MPLAILIWCCCSILDILRNKSKNWISYFCKLFSNLDSRTAYFPLELRGCCESSQMLTEPIKELRQIIQIHIDEP